jgi:hypothetical protein
MNWRTIRRYGWISHFKNDPLYFRTEIYMIVPETVFRLLYVFFYSNIGVPPRPGALIAYSTIAAILHLLFGISCRLGITGGLACCIQIKSLFTSKKEIQSSDIQIENILRDPEVFEMMSDYCQQEFSIENLLLWSHLESLTSNTTVSVVQIRYITIPTYNHRVPCRFTQDSKAI